MNWGQKSRVFIKITPDRQVFTSEHFEDPEAVNEVGTWEDPLNTANYEKPAKYIRRRQECLAP